MVTEATSGNHLVDQHGLHCAWWPGVKNSMIWIQQRQKKTNKCKSQLQFFRCFMPSHGGFTLWLIFSGGLSLSSSYSSAGLIVDSQVNVFYNADQLTFSQLDWPVKHGKGRGVDIAQLQEHRGSRSSTRGWTKEVHITLWYSCMPSWIMLENCKIHNSTWC